MDIPRSVLLYLSSELIYLIEDFYLTLTFGEFIDEIIEIDLDPCRDAYHAHP